MKKTKRILMALLSFCLMGNVVFAQDGCVDGFYYEYINGKPCVVGYHDDAPNNLVFPKIGGVPVVIYKGFSEGVRNAEDVVSFDLTNVELVMANSLTNVIVDENWEEVLAGFLNLNKVTVGANTRYGTNAFSGISVSSVDFAVGVSAVTSNMIAPFKSTLTSVDLSEINSIGDYAFQNCTSLTGSLELLSSVTNVGKYAFENTGYTSAFISALTVLPEGIFKNASKLKSVIASKVTEIKANAFFNCDKLSSVTADALTVVGNSAFEDCDGITITTLENFPILKTIGESAFFKASKLDGTLTFSANLESVGSNAFASTGLDAVVLKSNPSMGTNAFNNSNMLTLEISDATELNLDNTNTYGKVTYTRNTMTKSETGARKYAGLILPFDPVPSEDYVFYQLNSSSNSTEVVFDRVDSPVANTPYLFEYLGSTGAVTFVSDGAVIIGGSHTHEFTAGSSWKATGVYKKQTMSSGSKLYSIKGGEFTRYENNLTVNPYRVYWTAPTTNAIKFRNGSDDVTEVEFAEIEDVNIPATYYDLTGRRVLEPVKGNLYIVNGKKVVY